MNGDHEEAAAWLAKASGDLEIAEDYLNADPPDTINAMWSITGSVEKSLRAFLEWHNAGDVKTDDLVELGRECLRIDDSLSDIVQQAMPMTEFGWMFHNTGPYAGDMGSEYQSDEEPPTLDETVPFLQLAMDVYRAVAERLPDDLLPGQAAA